MRKLKSFRITAGVLVLVFCLTLFPVQVFAGNSTDVGIKLTANKASVLPGDTVVVTVSLTETNNIDLIDGSPIGIFQALIGYDKNAFTYTSVDYCTSENTLNSGKMVTDEWDGPGTVWIYCEAGTNLLSSADKNADHLIDMMAVTFTAKDYNQGTYNFSVIQNATDDGTLIVTTNVGGGPPAITAQSSSSVELKKTTTTPEATPNIAIDYSNEKLTGFGSGSYTINGTAVSPVSGKLDVASYIGSTISIVKKGDGTATTDSTAQSLVIPARPGTPAGTVSNPTTVGGTGSITGVTAAMEYKLSSDSSWTATGGTTVSNLAAGTYNVRVKATASAFASLSQSLTITVSTEYLLTINLNGGNGNATSGNYISGTSISLQSGTRSGYTFDGWTSSNGGTFANANVANTTFVMPANATTITATWKLISSGGSSGGGGGGSGGGGTTVTPKPDVAKPKLPEYPTLPAKGFADVKEHWAKDAIEYLSTKGIVKGEPDGTFKPDDKITRGQFVKLLGETAGMNQESYKTAVFNDVTSTDWYSPYVAWANEKGITTGVGEDMFKPNELISREEMAVMISRMLTVMNYTLEGKSEKVVFSDSAEISPYAKSAVDIMQTANIVGGKGDNKFAPKDSASRAEATTMIARILTTVTNEK